MKKPWKEIVQELRDKGRPETSIMDHLVNRLDAKDETIKAVYERNAKLKQQLIDSQIESGRRKKVKVDGIIRTGWGNYLYYDSVRYKYSGAEKAWVEDKNPNSLNQYRVEHLPGTFKVTLILADKSMPRQYTSTAMNGSFQGKHILLCPDFLVNVGDEFIMFKKEKENG